MANLLLQDWREAEILLAAAELELRESIPIEQRDPIARLLDPTFTDVLWEYEHSKVGLDIPGNLHAKQVEALNNRAKHRLLCWGNQAGKSTTGAIDLVLKALGRHPLQLAGLIHMPPMLSWASALTWELWEKILLPELLTWIPQDRIIEAPPAHQQSTKRDILIRADNGKVSRITGKAAQQGAALYQSARVDDVWLDEEHPEAVWDEIQPRLLRYGGRTMMTMTPLKGMGTFIYGRIYEPMVAGRVPPDRHWYSHAGTEDNPSITPEAREELRAELKNNPSQLAAREHGLFTRPIGAVYPFDIKEHGVDIEDIPAFVKRTKHYGFIDLGKWRFAFGWGGVDQDGSLTLVDEVFSQNESVDVRAKRIHGQLTLYGVKEITILGDCADPNGIIELNKALERLESPYRVWPVEAEFKHRQTGILRVESLLTRKALFVRRGMAAGEVWRLGMSSSSAGKPVEGSRLIWEFNNWQYPKMPDGKVQKDDPDDATADGADMMDGVRYLVMTWLGPLEIPKAKRYPTVQERLQKEIADLDKQSEQAKQANRFGNVIRQ